ncbi:helix-turn-helix transcriptional regulator, partial [bacterium]
VLFEQKTVKLALTTCRNRSVAQLCGRSPTVSRDLYKQLSHPMRRQIISLLGSTGEMSATRLMSELGLSPGNFYYHLGFINPLIVRQKDGLYALSEAGHSAYTQVLSWDVVSEVTASSGQINNRFFDLVCLGKLGSAKRIMLIAAVALLVAFEFSSYAFFRIIPRGFFIERMHSSGITDVLLGYSTGLILFMLVMSVQLRALKKSLSLERMVMIYVLAGMPFAIFSAIASTLIAYNVETVIVNVAFLCFQTWSIMILISHLSKSVRITLTSAGLMSLLCVYANLAALFFNLPFSLVF